MVFEDSKVLVFKDINPKAPTHLLLIPKHREGLTQVSYPLSLPPSLYASLSPPTSVPSSLTLSL